jgi:hypothetical protein
LYNKKGENSQGICWSVSGGPSGRALGQVASLLLVTRAVQCWSAEGACGKGAAGIQSGAAALVVAPACRAHTHPSLRLKHSKIYFYLNNKIIFKKKKCIRIR